MQTNMKTANRKKLQLQALVDSGCTHTRINKQLVKEEKIKTESIDRSFKVFNTDRTKNGEFTQYILIEVKINRYKEQIDIVVIDLNSIDMFLEYDWLVKHNPEVNWNIKTIWFIRYPKSYSILYQDILFRNRIL